MLEAEIRFYNSLTKTKEVFQPIRRGGVYLYACGPTVYQYAHIGNFRTYIFEDVLKRTLEYAGFRVKHIMNITDVGHLTSDADTGEDKVEQAAKKEHKTAKEIAQFYAQAFQNDFNKLNIKPPTKYAWASRYIKPQIKLIQQLKKKGFTYQTADGIYFDTAKLPDYGKLKSPSEGQARVEHSSDKKSPTDFALWKFSLDDEKRQQEWSSPWGVGYPGWHLECSAISTKELGQPFDIHTGGEDHIGTHHNNEIAQSEAAYDKPLANYWLHSAFLLSNNNKMSKSKGDFITLADLEQMGYDPLVYRYLAVSSHYRSKLNFSETALQSAQNSLNKLRDLFAVKTQGGRVIMPVRKAFFLAISDDLNMPEALATLWALVKSDNSLADKQATILDFDRVLGLGLKNYHPPIIPKEIIDLANQREKARGAKDWSKSDELRIQIKEKGYLIFDTDSGYTIKSK
ncbi:cysteine--tRNA ligase [Patescibacteria group bacterium]|nr:cysteine--tRNA ligase [Patescibacteria group bacterium]